jgi:hypothetical protein
MFFTLWVYATNTPPTLTVLSKAETSIQLNDPDVAYLTQLRDKNSHQVIENLTITSEGFDKERAALLIQICAIYCPKVVMVGRCVDQKVVIQLLKGLRTAKVASFTILDTQTQYTS